MVEIPGYVIVRELGAGGFGAVYEARDHAGVRVAIKVLHAEGTDELRRFHREARLLLAQAENEHVVQFRDCRLDTDPAYLVMEYCAGGSLRRLVGTSPSWKAVAEILRHTMRGLGDIHAAGGFHRDLKPDNLLLHIDPTGRKIVKVADFGIARLPMPFSSTPLTRSAMGTEGYIAPELYVGSPYDARCDVFSLGVTAIELMTGGLDAAALDPATMPRALLRLLRTMVATDPAERPTLMECQSALRSLSKKPKGTAAKGRVIPTRPGGTGWGAVGGLALIAGVALATMNSRDGNGRWHGSDGRFRSGPWG